MLNDFLVFVDGGCKSCGGYGGGFRCRLVVWMTSPTIVVLTAVAVQRDTVERYQKKV
jgi:hypothetical protein